MAEKTRGKAKRIIIAAVAAVLLIAAVFGLWYIIDGDGVFSGLENTLQSSGSSVADLEGIGITCLDVGQGDCSFVVCDGRTMLIDAGESVYSERVIGYLRSVGVKKLDYVVCSHFHSDHIGSMSAVIDEFRPTTVIMPSVPPELIPDTAAYGSLIRSVDDCGAGIITPLPGDSFELGGAQVVTVGPVNELTDNHNDLSLVMKIKYGKRSFLFTGDAEEREETDIVNSGADIRSDVLKVGHHGSSSSSSPGFLNAVSPVYCVISVGAGNDYGHPHDTVLNALSAFTDKIYRTDICGNVYLYSDGESITIKLDK